MQRRAFLVGFGRSFGAASVGLLALSSLAQSASAAELVARDDPAGPADPPPVYGPLPADDPPTADDPPADDTSDQDQDQDTDVDQDAPDPLEIAFAQLGKPYIWGSVAGRSYFGPTPRGFDCSGFASYVLRLGYGRVLPASTAASFPLTRPTDAPRRGDLVYFNMASTNMHVQHMAVYLDDGQMIQAGGVRNDVNVASVTSVGRPTFRRLP